MKHYKAGESLKTTQTSYLDQKRPVQAGEELQRADEQLGWSSLNCVSVK